MAYCLTSKSQVTLPKAIREHLNVLPGDTVNFRIVNDGSVRVEPATAPKPAQARVLVEARKRFTALRGSGGQGGTAGTDALMALLRGADMDSIDPGFSAPSIKPQRPRPRK